MITLFQGENDGTDSEKSEPYYKQVGQPKATPAKVNIIKPKRTQPK